MTEQERITIIEEQITLEALLPGVNLSYLPPVESAKLKRAVLDLYRLGHASGFDAGADHAIAGLISPRRNALLMQWMKRWLSARMREYWQRFKKSVSSIRQIVIKSPQPRRFPTEILSSNSVIRR
jgi:hypothetical protein